MQEIDGRPKEAPALMEETDAPEHEPQRDHLIRRGESQEYNQEEFLRRRMNFQGADSGDFGPTQRAQVPETIILRTLLQQQTLLLLQYGPESRLRPHPREADGQGNQVPRHP